MRYWDSSALVPLVVEQQGAAAAEIWLAEDSELVTWALTSVELVSAINRLAREGRLGEPEARRAEEMANAALRTAHVVRDLEAVKSLALRLLRLHALRVADALQLAAALFWADGRPVDHILHTFDRNLAIAATREGFQVIPGLGD